MQADRRDKKIWVKPELRRMRAGAAEDGARNAPDGGFPS